MRVRVEPGGTLDGEAAVPGDKSIAHRWLILASTAVGASRVAGLPLSLDVRSTAAALASLLPPVRPQLEAWIEAASAGAQGHGFTWDTQTDRSRESPLEVEGEGREALSQPEHDLDCGNSGTTMRLLAGLVAACPIRTVLRGDPSLMARPMQRVAEPLRRMGAAVQTEDGRPPLVVSGGRLHGIRHETDVPSAQVKGCVLLAGLAAEGQTEVVERVRTRDHTERALGALGAPVGIGGLEVSVREFQHDGFSGSVPGDVSSSAFLVAAAALTGSELTLRGVGLNPSRTAFLDVMERMGVRTQTGVTGEELGEPIGDLHVARCEGLAGTRVDEAELPLVHDEVPVLAALAAHASDDSWFCGAAELRVKESDRLEGLADGFRRLGAHAAIEGDDLVIAGGGLAGGTVGSAGDHRMAMAFTVAGLAARSAVEVDGIEAADVSFPGFVPTLVRLGARIGG